MFKALYRKYRPTSFADVVGQNHTVSILKNAIENNKIAHAYIFYGPRGTGKTSIAKIFANEVNSNSKYMSDSVDIIEIDAASNNGVDEIREIKEVIKYAPTESKYKVYIIDEVHMLTMAAFNALLKTLEEPPAHIIFILATTEIHKIPATILSRCQKFEFKNLTNKELVSRLEYIAQTENITISEQALNKIALIAKGGLRDAIGILDQVSNYSNANVDIDDVLEITSSISDSDILALYRHILKNDTNQVLQTYNNLMEKGKDSKLLINDLINLTRDAVIYKNSKNIQGYNYNLEEICGDLDATSMDNLYKNIEYLSQAETNMRFSTEYIPYMQVCLIKMSAKEEVASSVSQPVNPKISILESRINELEEKITILNKKIKANSSQVRQEEPGEEFKLQEVEVKREELPKPTEFIIPNKDKLLQVMKESDQKFTDYAVKVYNKLLHDSKIKNLEIYELFEDSVLKLSSKNAGVLIFKDSKNIFKLNTDNKYKEYFENMFKQILGVEYIIYILQEEQFNFLNSNVEKVAKKEEKVVTPEEEIKKSKIEELFSDIIEI